jgi:hypothetical protein
MAELIIFGLTIGPSLGVLLVGWIISRQWRRDTCHCVCCLRATAKRGE